MNISQTQLYDIIKEQLEKAIEQASLNESPVRALDKLMDLIKRVNKGDNVAKSALQAHKLTKKEYKAMNKMLDPDWGGSPDARRFFDEDTLKKFDEYAETISKTSRGITDAAAKQNLIKKYGGNEKGFCLKEHTTCNHKSLLDESAGTFGGVCLDWQYDKGYNIIDPEVDPGAYGLVRTADGTLLPKEQIPSNASLPARDVVISGPKIAGHSGAVNNSGQKAGIWVDDFGRSFVTLQTDKGPVTFTYSSGTSYLMKNDANQVVASPRHWYPVGDADDAGRYGKYYPEGTGQALMDPRMGKGDKELWSRLKSVDGNWDNFLTRKYGADWPRKIWSDERITDDVTKAIADGAIGPAKTWTFGKYPEPGSEFDRMAQELLRLSPDGKPNKQLEDIFGGAMKGPTNQYNSWRKGEVSATGTKLEEAYEKENLNEVDPSLQRGSPTDYSKDPERDERAKKWTKWYNKKKKDMSPMKQRVVKSTRAKQFTKAQDPEAKPINIPGLEDTDWSDVGTESPEETEEYKKSVVPEKDRTGSGRAPWREEDLLGDIYSDEELDNAQLAGELSLGLAEPFVAGALGPAGVAGAAFGELGAMAADSPSFGRPGEAQVYRSGSDRQLTNYFRKARKERRENPERQTKKALADALSEITPYIQKTASGNIIIRGGGSSHMGSEVDRGKLSDVAAREIKANFLDIRKRLMALKRGPKFTKEIEAKLVAQAKKLGKDPKEYIAKMKNKYKKQPESSLALLEGEINKSQLKKLIAEEATNILSEANLAKLDDIFDAVRQARRGTKWTKYAMPDDEVKLIQKMIKRGDITKNSLPSNVLAKFEERAAQLALSPSKPSWTEKIKNVFRRGDDAAQEAGSSGAMISRTSGKYGASSDMIEISGATPSKEFLESFRDAIYPRALDAINRRDLKSVLSSYESRFKNLNARVRAIRNDLKALRDQSFGMADSQILHTRAIHILTAVEAKTLQKQARIVEMNLVRGAPQRGRRPTVVHAYEKELRPSLFAKDNHDLIVVSSNDNLNVFEMNKRSKAAGYHRIPENSAISRYRSWAGLKSEADSAAKQHRIYSKRLNDYR